jgi:FixJ family two-component response regulator
MIRDSFKIVVVEDDDAVRDSLLALFHSTGLDADGYASAEAFLSVPPAEQPACAVIDVYLPGKSGLQLQEFLAATMPTLPVVVITGGGNSNLEMQARANGAVAFFEKPVDASALMLVIRRLLGNQ